MAATSGLDNYKNIFPYTYESRYVSGVVAGMKLKELMDAGTVTDPKVGYVGAYPLCRGGLRLHRFPAGHPVPWFPRPTWTCSTPTPGMIPWLRARPPMP